MAPFQPFFTSACDLHQKEGFPLKVFSLVCFFAFSAFCFSAFYFFLVFLAHYTVLDSYIASPLLALCASLYVFVVQFDCAGVAHFALSCKLLPFLSYLCGVLCFFGWSLVQDGQNHSKIAHFLWATRGSRKEQFHLTFCGQ